MKYYLNIVQIVVILFAFFANSTYGNQPSYQVSLYVHLHPQKPSLHMCNGVIVQSRLILTTASCVHYKISSSSPVVLLEPNMISIIGGSSTKHQEEVTLQVADIFVIDKFNYSTGENDLALLRLNGILPLDIRNDLSWITLEDDKEYNEPCLANYFVRNFSNALPNYIQSEQMPILDSEACRVASQKLIIRKNDICSLYYPPTDLNCNELELLQNYNGDRGTGLVCGNKLIGLLSSILPRQNVSDCKEEPFKAYYTAVVPHIIWIFNIITEEDFKMYSRGEYISSSPYAAETNAFVETHATETVTFEAQTTPVFLESATATTEFLAQNNTANTLDKINCKLLSGTLCVIFLFFNAFNCCL